MSKKINFLLLLCRKSRFILLLPTIICWCFALTSCKSAANCDYGKNSTDYALNDVIANDEYSIITILAKITTVIVILVDANSFPQLWTIVVIIAIGATSGFTSAATVTLASRKPAPTILPSPVAMSPLSKNNVREAQISSTSISPQKKQSQAPLLQISNDIEFVPLTREFIELLDDRDRYNRYATPNQYDGIATNVSMSMYIEGISSFSAQTMDYHLDMYFYQEWRDLRLRHNGTGPMLIRDKSVFKKIWHPDIYFANARHASFQEITEDNFLMWVYPSGRIWYDCRISLVAICMMDLWKYPLDSQICELRILSYAYPESQLRLRWSETINPPIDRNLEIRMPDMKLVDIKTGGCNGTYATGKWSCMTAVFYVQREMMHHIIQTYVPTALIVVISWFNFWLDIDSAPARVSLSITTLLTIATQANAVKLALPEVSYMKAIDVWMGMCMAFVFSVMVEYTIAHFAKNREQRQRMRQAMHNSNFMVDSTLSTLFDTTQHFNDGFHGAPPHTAFMSTPMFSNPNSAKSSTSGGAALNSTRRTSISARVRESLKRKRQSISSTVMAPFRNATSDGHGTGAFPEERLESGTGVFRPDVAEPLHTVLQYPPLVNDQDGDEFFEDAEFGYAEDGALFTENFNQLHCNNNNNGALRNSPKKNIRIDTPNKSTDDRRHRRNYVNYMGNNTTEARLRIPQQLRSSETVEDLRSTSVEPVSVSATVGTAKSAPVCFSLTDEDESEIVVVRQKRNYRDSVSRFGKHMGRRAQAMRKSWSKLTGHEVATKIDQRSRIVFPSAFILFNIIYWSYYLVFN